MNETQSKVIKLAFLALYLVVVFIINHFYSESMFKYSLQFQKQIQNDISKSMAGYLKFITNFGTSPVLLIIQGLAILFLPLNLSFNFVQLMAMASFTNNFFKLVYSNPRPFWIDHSLLIHCNNGYGNPSGHSLDSVTVYLSVWHVMISYITIFKRNIIVKIILLLFFLQFIIAIMFSRLYLGVHSIDQILLGALLGLAVYYLHFFVLEYHIKDADTFFSYFTEKLYILIHSIVFLVIFIVFVLVFTLKDYSKYNDQYAEMLNRLCGEIKLYKYFQYDGFNGGLVIFTLIGSYYGIVTLLYLLRNKTIRLNDLNNWNLVENWKKDIIRVLFMIPFALPLILYFLVPGKSSLAVIYIFKDIVPFLVGMICVYGIGIYVCVIYKRANPFILEERTLENEN